MKCQNQIKPELMEALQMLKFTLKGQRLDFGSGWTTGEGSLGIEDYGPGAGVVNTVDVLDEAMKASGDGAWDRIAKLLGDDGVNM